MPLHLVGGGAVGVAVVRRSTRQQEVQRAAQRVQVGPGVTGVGVVPLLGSHVVGRAEALPRRGQGGGCLLLRQECQPHVEDLDLPRLLGHEQVRRLDVAMYQAQFVSSCQPLRRLPDRLARIDDRHRPLGLDELLQVLALDVLHRQVMHSADLTRVESLDNVRMLQRPDGQHLALEPRQGIGPREEVLRQNLQGHQLAELGMSRPVNSPHAALAQLGEQLVRTKLAADIHDRTEHAHRQCLARSGLLRGMTACGLRRHFRRCGDLTVAQNGTIVGAEGSFRTGKHPRDDASLLGKSWDVVIRSRCFTLSRAVFKFHGQQFGQQSVPSGFRSLCLECFHARSVTVQQLSIETVTQLVNLRELLGGQ